MKRPEGFDPSKSQPDKSEPGKKADRQQGRAKVPRTGREQPLPDAPIKPAARKPSASGAAPTQGAPAQGAPAVVSRLRRTSTKTAPPSRQKATPEPKVREPKSHATSRTERAEARRFTRGSRRRRAAWFTTLGIVGLLVVVLLVAVFSPILALRTIQVDGVSAIPASTVQKALSGQLGTPLALLNDQTIRRKLSHIILIRSYATEVVPPNTLVVRIVEREAIAVLPDGSGYDEVDPAGVVLRKSATTAGLPVIQIGSAGVDSPGFAAAVKVLLAMPSSILTEVSSISATTLDNVNITLAGSKHIILWGSSAQSDLKAQVLADLLARCASQPVLNVTAPLAIACGPIPKTPTPTPFPTSTSGT